MPSKIYKAVIFDLDGTLLDTLPDIETAVHKVLANHDLPDPHSTADFRKMVGWGARDLMRRAVPAAWQSAEHLDELTRELITEYLKEPYTATIPYPGIPELLTALEERALPKAILSNKPHELVLTIVAHCLSPWNFTPIQGADSAFPHKPAPAAALHLAGQLQLRPEEIIFLGDSEVDMETALNAGMLPVGATWGYQTKADLLRGGASRLLDSPPDLLAFFK